MIGWEMGDMIGWEMGDMIGWEMGDCNYLGGEQSVAGFFCFG